MGTSHHVFAGPASGQMLTLDAFNALLTELFEARVMSLPVSVISGALDTYPFGLPAFAEREEGQYGDKIVHYRGSDLARLLQTLAQAGYRNSDLCVRFQGFDLNNPAVKTSFGKRYFSNVSAQLYAFTSPRAIEIEYIEEEEDAFKFITVRYEVQFANYFCSSGKGGHRFFSDTPLEPILLRHYGPDLKVECSSG